MDRNLLARAYLFLGPVEAAAALAAFFFVLETGGWHYGQPLGAEDPLYRAATTACLSAIVVTQVVNVHLCRDARASILSMSLFENRLILAGIAAEVALILALVYTPIGNALFGTAPLTPAAWLFMLPFAAAMLFLEEGRKALARRRPPRQRGHRPGRRS